MKLHIVLILFSLRYGMVARMVEEVEGFIVSSAAALGAGLPPCSRLLVRYTVTHSYMYMQCLHACVIFLCITIWLSLICK